MRIFALMNEKIDKTLGTTIIKHKYDLRCQKKQEYKYIQLSRLFDWHFYYGSWKVHYNSKKPYSTYFCFCSFNCSDVLSDPARKW